MDFKSGCIIMEENSYECLLLVSLIKMMIVYIVECEFDEGWISMLDMVLISVWVWKIEGLCIFVCEGISVLVEDLLKGVIIQFGNDVLVVLVEFVVGSEDVFVDIMNQQVQLLGMKGINFENVIGLLLLEYFLIVYDLVLLVWVIINDYLENYLIYVEKYFIYNNIC